MAQATISRLQGLLSEKETAITTLREALVESRRKMLEQQERDRHEIGRLNEALFLRNEKSIQVRCSWLKNRDVRWTGGDGFLWYS